MTELDEILDQLRDRYENGDKSAIPSGISLCVSNNLPIPPWLGTAFHEAYCRVINHEVKSWDCVLGKPILKGQRLHKLRRDTVIAGPFWGRIRERHAAGDAIGKKLFGEVGAEFGIGTTVAEELYYSIKKEFDQL